MLTDKQYIDGIMLQDGKVFEMFVKQYKNYVFTICMNILKNNAIAEEAAQDTFMKVFKSIQQFNQESKLSSWMYRIAYRTSLDYLKKRKLYSVDTSEYDYIADSTNISTDLHHQELIDQIRQLLLEMDPIDATVMTLFYFEQKSIKEIQEVTELTESNIKSKLFRSRKWLRKELSSRFESTLNVLI